MPNPQTDLPPQTPPVAEDPQRPGRQAVKKEIVSPPPVRDPAPSPGDQQGISVVVRSYG
ncbi:hypothetical protein HNQ50_000742 [Silvimonas terrae]|uniref:Uncharacterized protein n=1 Tax=Silvimonas terrae TaxID=300266 RepID=A0A840RCI4_9NEIS|nr:hypothetical protein [Silvimonas terrae]MBB5190032.1 hypothetical protein [Silvimonas terrae]